MVVIVRDHQHQQYDVLRHASDALEDIRAKAPRECAKAERTTGVKRRKG